MLVQSAGLLHVNQACLVLGDAVTKFVADDVERDREAIEQRAVAVAKHHALAVPESIVVAIAVVNGCVQWQAVVIDGIALKHVGEEVECVPQPVKGFVDGFVAGLRLAFGPDRFAGQCL